MGDRSGSEDTDTGGDRDSGTGLARWLKVSVIVALVIGLLIVTMLLIGGGEHGPARHGFSGEPTGQPSLRLFDALTD
jgi:hypothetical protein